MDCCRGSVPRGERVPVQNQHMGICRQLIIAQLLSFAYAHVSVTLHYIKNAIAPPLILTLYITVPVCCSFNRNSTALSISVELNSNNVSPGKDP
jgi:hypothetical protein